jgi:hypothetical protein
MILTQVAAMCSWCLAHRTDLPTLSLETACAGRRTTQIDCGDDILFPGIPLHEVPVPPCPRCGTRRYVIAVDPSVASRFGPSGLWPPG